jgi:hypothetical protein
MRSIGSVLVGSVLVVAAVVAVGAVVAWVPGAARAENGEGVTVERMEALERRVRALEEENSYLLGREAALTRAALAADASARNLVAGVEAARREGFELAAFPAPSRAVVLRSLEGLARDLSGAVPTPTAEETRLAKEIAARRRATSR